MGWSCLLLLLDVLDAQGRRTAGAATSPRTGEPGGRRAGVTRGSAPPATFGEFDQFDPALDRAHVRDQLGARPAATNQDTASAMARTSACRVSAACAVTVPSWARS